ncbi:cytochrome c peroxidase [Methylobacterium sp. 190mf]|uniref:cytochrome-c peroxidase n=1 Tax=Methylobacterium sp. 190mf TaxID=1761798 RepID=UPI00089F05D6|nr:cytochrome c peroxidase [Methylobacterium sp. 190mf]SEG70044.1 cytochrome c peroxidase [Methylobacterium sp. 190mf]
MRSSSVWKACLVAATLAGLFSATGEPEAVLESRGRHWRAAYRVPSEIPFPAENPYSAAKAELGRRPFFDPILSGDRTRACVSCHLPDLAWGDGRARAASRDQTDMDLRSPTLLNMAWQDGPLGWVGKFRDLESVTAIPLTAPGNMNLTMAEAVARVSGDAGYRAAFAAAFPDPEVTPGKLEAAIATFERLIVAVTSPFDRWIAGDDEAIGAAARRGFDLFNGRAGCAACHSGWSFTDGSFHDIGVGSGADIGRGRYVKSSTALRYAFKTPTLRDVARRAPYMHDGSVGTLDRVIDLYDRGGIDRPSRSRQIRPLHLTSREKTDLLAFLNALTSTSQRDLMWADFADAPPTLR